MALVALPLSINFNWRDWSDVSGAGAAIIPRANRRADEFAQFGVFRLNECCKLASVRAAATLFPLPAPSPSTRRTVSTWSTQSTRVHEYRIYLISHCKSTSYYQFVRGLVQIDLYVFVEYTAIMVTNLNDLAGLNLQHPAYRFLAYFTGGGDTDSIKQPMEREHADSQTSRKAAQDGRASAAAAGAALSALATPMVVAAQGESWVHYGPTHLAAGDAGH